MLGLQQHIQRIITNIKNPMAAMINIGIMMIGIKNKKTIIPMTTKKIFNNPRPHLQKQQHTAHIINSKSRNSNYITSISIYFKQVCIMRSTNKLYIKRWYILSK